MTSIFVLLHHPSHSTRRSSAFVAFCGLCVFVLTAGCYRESPAPKPQETGQLLVLLLSDGEAALRRTAAEALGKIGDRSAAPFLVRTLRDSDPAVRAAAARSLGQLAPFDSDTGAELVPLIQDPDDTVRRAAAQALGQAENLPVLTAKLADLATGSTSNVRLAAMHALMLMDARDASAALAMNAQDTDPDVRQEAVAALTELGDVRVVPILKDRLLHDAVSGVRAEAAYRLGIIGDKSVLAVLEHAAALDGSVAVRRWAQKSRDELRRVRGSD